MQSKDSLNKIYFKTDGHCHICHRKLTFNNHGAHGNRGAWHVDHSVPKAKGGTNHLNNLYPACIKCNIEKGTMHTKTARSWSGNTRAPYSAKTKKKIRNNKTATGAIIGGTIGMLLGPGGTMLGAAIGGAIGNSNSPKK